MRKYTTYFWIAMLILYLFGGACNFYMIQSEMTNNGRLYGLIGQVTMIWLSLFNIGISIERSK